jgi:3-hydroxybutyryl-CoA dehydrogenase
MILAVLASDAQKEEIANAECFQKHEIVYSENISLWTNHIADGFMDLTFSLDPERINKLTRLLPKPVFVGAVTETLDQINPSFIRINNWPGFLKGKYLEASAGEEAKNRGRNIFDDQILFVEDKPGFVSARIVAMIINEAYFAWEAGISSKEEIDMAMKLGTGYPYGPFEWAELIGTDRIVALLEKLNELNPVYEIARGLKVDS